MVKLMSYSLEKHIFNPNLPFLGWFCYFLTKGGDFFTFHFFSDAQISISIHLSYQFPLNVNSSVDASRYLIPLFQTTD